MQKKNIIEVYKNNKELGLRELCRVIGTELDLFVSKSSLHRILRSKDEIKNVKTTPKTTRTKIVSPIIRSMASGVSSLPIFISSSVPRNLFVDEKSKINNFEIIKTNGIVQKESAGIFHVNHNGVDKEAIFMKSSRGG